MPLKQLFVQFEQIDSTHDFAKANLPYFKKETLTTLFALNQTKGHGKELRPWISMKGNIHLTLHYQLSTPHPHLHQLSNLLAYTLYQSIPNHETLLSFKFPNDLYFEEKKCAGVLTDIVDQHLIMSVGCNVEKRPSEAFSNLYFMKRDELLLAFLKNFEKYFELFIQSAMTSNQVPQLIPCKSFGEINSVLR